MRNQTTHWISGLNVCVFSTSPVSDLRSDSAGLSKIDAARGMGPGWISGLESGCDGWQKFDQSGDLQVSEVGGDPIQLDFALLNPELQPDVHDHLRCSSMISLHRFLSGISGAIFCSQST